MLQSTLTRTSVQRYNKEACIGFSGYRVYVFYFQGYRILSILLLGIWDSVSIILVTFRDIKYIEKIIMGKFTSLEACIGGSIYPISLEVNRQISLIN